MGSKVSRYNEQYYVAEYMIECCAVSKKGILIRARKGKGINVAKRKEEDEGKP